jgi:hypothetical protein
MNKCEVRVVVLASSIYPGLPVRSTPGTPHVIAVLESLYSHRVPPSVGGSIMILPCGNGPEHSRSAPTSAPVFAFFLSAPNPDKCKSNGGLSAT